MKTSIIPPPDLTRDESERWLRLIVYAAGGKQANPARVLGVSPNTFKRWYEGGAPLEWWMRSVYIATVDLYVKYMRTKITSTRSDFRRQVYTARLEGVHKRLEQLPSDQYFINQQNTSFSEAFHRAVKLIREHCPPGKRIAYSDLREHFEGLSIRTIARARDHLGVERGKIPGTVSIWWRMPHADDED